MLYNFCWYIALLGCFLFIELFFPFETSYTVTPVKQKLALFSTLDTILLIIDILDVFWCFLIAFSTESEMLVTLLRYCRMILIPRFGTILIKKILKKLLVCIHFYLTDNFCYIVT